MKLESNDISSSCISSSSSNVKRGDTLHWPRYLFNVGLHYSASVKQELALSDE